MICKYCKKEFENKKSYASHSRWCKLNPNYENELVFLKKRREAMVEARRVDDFPNQYSIAKDEGRIVDTSKIKQLWLAKLLVRDFDTMSQQARRKFVLHEQGGKCLHCEISDWNGKEITLQLDHIDGNKKNNTRENFRMLCPNCHSQTETWCKKKTAL